jgi:tRNA (cytidine/uridine-2'-O-)-methyltransferase|tara:strand:+ start:277 stop:726 length:450 start_codon:yes stop_codon:yes gene_type:complete
MISIALYKPDIPQNTASIIRFSACYGINVHIIEPCGFNLNDSRFKRVVMDYINLVEISRYYDFQDLVKKNKNSRIILMTTKAKKSVFKFDFKKNDIILLGRESKGVPEFIHNFLNNKIKIPISNKSRSLNVALSAAISATEALRQLKKF